MSKVFEQNIDFEDSLKSFRHYIHNLKHKPNLQNSIEINDLDR